MFAAISTENRGHINSTAISRLTARLYEQLAKTALNIKKDGQFSRAVASEFLHRGWIGSRTVNLRLRGTSLLAPPRFYINKVSKNVLRHRNSVRNGTRLERILAPLYRSIVLPQYQHIDEDLFYPSKNHTKRRFNAHLIISDIGDTEITKMSIEES